jgi:pyruvate formate lyase activating enzyme
MKEALLYHELPDDVVRCDLCAHHCRVAPGKLGICQVRKNIDGILYTLVDDRLISQHVDPVEKKPLFHFYPGSKAYSVATPGCNFRCAWCQNWQIAQMPHEQHLIAGDKVMPEEIVAAAKASGSYSIAYTYTEPTVFFELAYATAQLAHAAGLANIYVTNGYMTDAMLTKYHIPRAAEMPATDVIFVQTDEPSGPFGAKSVAEISIDGVAPAIASAIHDATGVWMRELPYTPERVKSALRV